MAHLKEQHGIDVIIPHRKMGRPPKDKKIVHALPRPDVGRYARQSRIRFGLKEQKFKQNVKKYEKGQLAKAAHMWDFVLRDEDRVCLRDDYITEFVAKSMEKYMFEESNRLRKIQERIDAGFEYNQRKVIPHSQLATNEQLEVT